MLNAKQGTPHARQSDKSHPAALLTAQQSGREVFGVSERTFHNMRKADWMPRPIVLGPRILRWVRGELEAAALNMPRQEQPQAEPRQLQQRRAAGTRVDS